MSEAIEGTLLLDGLIEGRLPDDPDVRDKVEQWVEFAKEVNLGFTCDITGSSFSLLPDNEPIQVSRLGDTPDDTIKQALDQLLEQLPADMRSGVFSTLRSCEYKRNEEVQSVYGVNPDGTIEVAKRTVEAETVAPPEPISLGTKVKFGLFGLLLAVVLIGMTYFLPGTNRLWKSAEQAVNPPEPSEIVVAEGAFKPYFTVSNKEVDGGKRKLIVTLKRTDAYPKNNKEIDAAAQAAGTSVSKRLVVEAIAKGYLRVDLLGPEVGYYATAELRIGALSKREEIQVAVPLPTRHKLDRVYFRY